MPNTLEVRHVSVSVERAPDDVYRLVSNMETWPEWASGLGKSIRRQGSDWIADGPLGQVRVRLAIPNPFRVLDHDVTLPTGITVHNPLRVLPNGAGSEVIFSVFRQPDTSDHDFQADVNAVAKDLGAMKQLLERS